MGVSKMLLNHFNIYNFEFISIIQGAAEIVKHFKILVTCFSARVMRIASILT
jgi:hypothetical protein